MPLWTPSALAAHTFPVPDFYVEPLICADSTTVIFGPREAGKTQFVLTLARALQEVGPLLGRFETRPARMVLVQIDMPIVQMQRRIKAAAGAFAFNGDFRILDMPSLNLLGTATNAPWVCEIEDFDPQIVVFDTLRKSYRGDENDAETPSAVYGKARELFPDAGRVFLHHVSKPPSMTPKGAKVRDPDESFRGVSAWLDDADTGILLQRYRAHRTLYVVRARHADDDIKEEPTAFTMSESGLFLEPAEPTPLMRLLAWQHAANPPATMKTAVEWLEAEYPKMSRATRYRTANAAGWRADEVPASVRLSRLKAV